MRARSRSFVAGSLCAAAAVFSAPLAAQTGSVIDDRKLDGNTPGLPGRLDFLEHFGGSLASLGDLNGDGVLELLVGSPWDSFGGNRQGLVQILSVRSDGTVLGGVEIAEGLNGFVGPLDWSDSFGSSVACIGDLDGDGIPEVAVGAPVDDDGAFSDSGAVYVLFLNANGTVRAEQKISATEGGFTGSLVGFSNLGLSACALGDVDLDGVPDLAVGAPQTRSTVNTGKVYVLLLNTDGTVKTTVTLDEQHPDLADYVASRTFFGFALASPGDLDGNGFPDLFIGAPGFDGGANDTGVVVTAFLGAGGSVLGSAAFDLDGPGTTATTSGADFGSSLGFLGDLDADGTVELAVGSGLEATGSVAEWSEISIVSVDAAGLPTNTHEIAPQRNSIPSFVGSADDFGCAVASIGDLDGDGVTDIAVGARLDTSGGPSTGAVYLLRLSDGDPAAPIRPSATQGCPPLTVTFADASSGTGLSSWSWDFGDGATSSLASPTHVYAAEGTYTVSLEVVGADGLARSIEKDLIVVDDQPEMDFEASVTYGSIPLTVEFTDLSSPSVFAWSWIFGDGGTAFVQNPTHVYTEPGTYDVTLVGVCPTGSSQTVKVGYIQVDDGLQASVTSDNGIGVNEDVFTSTVDPELGTTWVGFVDGTLLGTPSLSILYGFLLPQDPGILIPPGELLVDVSSPLIATDAQPMGFDIAFHPLPVPSDLAFVGFTFSAQVVVTGGTPGPRLTNRLDFVLGF